MADMKKLLQSTLSAFVILTSMSLISAPALAAHPAKAGSAKAAPIVPIGNDVSWPQCNKSLPKGQLFGIVGVNDGLANNTNPCFATQIAWANASKGGTSQPKTALYVNTANPGLAGSWWPTSNVYGGLPVNDPYGTCDGSDSSACAYMYGYAKAYDDATIRGVSNPASYRWWLDVETGSSWETNTVSNVADLEGMTAYFESIGAQVGLYSTSYQWKQIVGTSVAPASNLNGLQSWIPGARSQSAAKTNCKLPALTLAGIVSLTQYVSAQTDYDYSCLN